MNTRGRADLNVSGCTMVASLVPRPDTRICTLTGFELSVSERPECRVVRTAYSTSAVQSFRLDTQRADRIDAESRIWGRGGRPACHRELSHDEYGDDVKSTCDGERRGRLHTEE